KGLDESVIATVSQAIELTPGVKDALATLKTQGYRVAVVSGGFIQVLEPLARELDLDYVRANTLEIEDGRLTGRVTGKVVDRKAKEEFLREFAADLGLEMEQTVAVGDGANDIDMINASGLGIAFNAKPALREHADVAINRPTLAGLVQILGGQASGDAQWCHQNSTRRASGLSMPARAALGATSMRIRNTQKLSKRCSWL